MAALEFIDPQNGWLSVRDQSSSNFSVGELFGTNDGGATWSTLSIPVGAPVYFVDASVGWTAGGPVGDQLYLTRDGGASWEQQFVESPSTFPGSLPAFGLPAFTGSGRGVLPVTFVGRPSGIAFYVSDDGGASWTSVATLTPPVSIGVGSRIPTDVIDATKWVGITPDGGKVFATRDGRNFDIKSPNGLPPGVDQVDFASEDVGWALVGFGTCAGFKSDCTYSTELLLTVDGGQTWERLSP